MVEVLERGERKVIYCKSCRSKLAYEPEDLQHGNYSNILPGDYWYIECPVCNERIMISDPVQKVREVLY